MYFQRLRDLREDADLSQKQVAALLGIQQTVYSRYERGFQTIPLEHLLTLADFYHVSTDYLLGRTKNPRINPLQKPARFQDRAGFLSLFCSLQGRPNGFRRLTEPGRKIPLLGQQPFCSRSLEKRF